jgi:predicted ATP-dependent endonuclease of OLD family
MASVVDVLHTRELSALETDIRDGALRQLGLDPSTNAGHLNLSFGPLEAGDFYHSLGLMLREGALTLDARDLGEGVQNTIVLAILQAFERRRKQGAVLLIEEPEMFLHPQRQRSLYEVLRKLSESNQVIYTTHSPHFVAIPEYEEVVIVRGGSAGTIVTRSNLVSSPQRTEKLRKELDPERGELFFATRVLLVEGDTEKLALPEYARRLGINLNLAGASIVEVGGKRNLLELAEVARSFGISVGVLYDADSPNFRDAKDEEARLNGLLDGLATADGMVRVWRLEPDYEGVLRASYGDSEFQKACTRFGGVTKAIRARLLAAEEGAVIPPLVEDALRWSSPG